MDTATEMEEECGTEGMLDLYLYESRQLLEQLEEIVLAKKNRIAFDENSINEIFRIMHTIKGSSGIMMYDNIALAAHKLEDIFYYLRESYPEDVPKKQLEEIIFEVSDFIEEELRKIKKGTGYGVGPDKIVRSVDGFLDRLKKEIREKSGELPPENLYVAPGQYYIAPVGDGTGLPPLKIDLGVEEEPAPGDYVVRREEEKEQKIIGVNAEYLEELYSLVCQLKSSWRQGTGKQEELLAGLEETVLRMKKVPLSETFRRMHRIVSEASRKLDKDMVFTVRGEEVEVDRSIAESLADPLMHLIRNAVDHGIEGKEERLLSGKKEEGHIELSAETKDGALFVTVRDDGRGIDRNKVFETARKKGMLGGEADISDYTDEEIFSFLTKPGFSTVDRITEYSGRGVGMDVAGNRLKKIGGKLLIKSAAGRGTEIRMEIPRQVMGG